VRAETSERSDDDEAIHGERIQTMIHPIEVGTIVNFVTESGEILPAIIVKVWNQEQGTSNLQVFLNDNGGMTWRTSIVRSDEPKASHWHYGG
jgi:hypothetical protein